MVCEILIIFAPNKLIEPVKIWAPYLILYIIP